MADHSAKYQSGFGNEFATEALPGALPLGQNSPQKVKYNLYAEQLSGTAFTMPIKENKRTWLYRMQPSVVHEPFEEAEHATLRGTPFDEALTPNQLRWSPFDMPEDDKDFIDGLVTIGGNGDSFAWSGCAIHVYTANKNMKDRYFYNADGEMLFVPQLGTLVLRTEMGVIDIRPGEIAVIQRGIKFAVDLPEGPSRGYVCENYGLPFTLPDRGPIGANGMANQREFLTPVAAYEEISGDITLTAKLGGKIWNSKMDHSPLDVVAWHGNYAPYKYDLDKFNAMNTVSYDHPDPSIFTVLTSPSYPTGTANIDFVIFPPRWLVGEDTFRPPYFHRNVMSEYMGLIHGVYDGKEGGGFVPGGASLHNCMAPHGPDVKTFEKGYEASSDPVYLSATLAFMFESRYYIRPTKLALESRALQKDYYKNWQGLKKNFKS